MTAALPLAGVTVLDFTWVLAGPFATRILGDLGATVIKVQRPAAGPGITNRNDTPHFRFWNRNKLGYLLDMNSPTGLQEALNLLQRVDVVIDNFSARVMPNWGLDFHRLLELNPRLVAVSMSGFGRTGPWRDWVSFGPTLHALSGLTDIMRYPEDPPTGFGFSYSDHVGGLTAACAVLAGLIRRERTGKGVWIDLAQLEACLYTFGPQVLAALTDPGFGPRGNQDWHDSDAVVLLLECEDDAWVTVTLFEDTELRALAAALGVNLPISRLSDVRPTPGPLERQLAVATRGQSRPKVLAALRASGLEAQPVQSAADLAADADLLASNFFWALEIGGQQETMDGLPFQFAPPYICPHRAAPYPGRDVEAIRQWQQGCGELG